MRITGTHRITDDKSPTRTPMPARAIAVALAVGLLTLAMVGLVGGDAFAKQKKVRRYWLYDPGSLSKTWKSEAKLRHAYNRWHRNRLGELEAAATTDAQDTAEAKVEKAERRAESRGDDLTKSETRAIEQEVLEEAEDDLDKIKVPRKEIKAFQSKLQKRYLDMHFNKPGGTFSGKATWFGGQRGACGKPLTGMYAAHRNLPCGTKLAVRSGGKYVHVTVLDRGPYTGAVIDLSKPAFSALSPLGAGVINVKVTKLKGR